METDPGLSKRVSEQDQIAQIAGEPIQPPYKDVPDMATLHHRQELLKPGPVQVLP